MVKVKVGHFAALMLFSGAASAALSPVINAGAQPVVTSSVLMGLYNRLEQLQGDVQQMRGQLEEQAHLIESLKKRQRDLYLDTDGRIQQLEIKGIQGSQQSLNIVEPALRAVPSSAVKTVSTSVTSTDDKVAYDKAYATLRAGKYPQAITDFSAFIRAYPKSMYLANAYYWQAEASYVNSDFKRALDDFNRVLTQFPTHSKAKDAMLKVGFIQYENKQWLQARKTLQAVATKYPGTTVASFANKRLERMRQEQH